MAKSIMQTEKCCYLTGVRYDLHKHHIFEGCRRKTSEDWGCWIYLQEGLHNLSGDGVHFNRELDRRLKAECQAVFEEKYSHDLWMQVFGKNYIHGPVEDVRAWFNGDGGGYDNPPAADGGTPLYTRGAEAEGFSVMDYALPY